MLFIERRSSVFKMRHIVHNIIKTQTVEAGHLWPAIGISSSKVLDMGLRNCSKF